MVGGETDEATKFIAPTIVRDVKADDSLMSEYVWRPNLTGLCSDNLLSEKYSDLCYPLCLWRM